jgi:hypothetical protein
MNVQILVTVEELLHVRAASRFLCRPEPMVVVCDWCPTKADNERQLAAHGFKISGGMCSACEKRERQKNGL